jgi:hypothetical protein
MFRAFEKISSVLRAPRETSVDSIRNFAGALSVLLLSGPLAGCSEDRPAEDGMTTEQGAAVQAILQEKVDALLPSAMPVVTWREGRRVLAFADAERAAKDFAALLDDVEDGLNQRVDEDLDVNVELMLRDDTGNLVPVTTHVVMGRRGTAAPLRANDSEEAMLMLVHGAKGRDGHAGADVEVALSTGNAQVVVIVGGRGGDAGGSPTPGNGGQVNVTGEGVDSTVIAIGGDGGSWSPCAQVVESATSGGVGVAKQAVCTSTGGNGASGGNGGGAFAAVLCGALVAHGGNAGNGAAGSTDQDGMNGGIGGPAIAKCDSNAKACTATATGGNGGNGGKGGSGTSAGAGGNGRQGGNAFAKAFDGFAKATSGKGGIGGIGGAGTQGTDGGDGGNGGNGGTTNATSNKGAATALSGAAGHGGASGTGAAGNGGNGGNGGAATATSKTNKAKATAGAAGYGGAAPKGDGGNGGNGGSATAQTQMPVGGLAKGGVGAKGGNGNPMGGKGGKGGKGGQAFTNNGNAFGGNDGADGTPAP